MCLQTLLSGLKMCLSAFWKRGQMLSVSDLIVLTVSISIHWRYRVFYQEHPVFSQICPFSFFICCWLCFDLLFRLFPQDSLDAVSCFQGISTGRRQLYLDVVWLSVVFPKAEFTLNTFSLQQQQRQPSIVNHTNVLQAILTVFLI